MEEFLLYHGSNETVDFPEIRKGKYTKDFSWGFYCTNNLEQAKRWARRFRENGMVNYYKYTPGLDLRILVFQELSDEWLDFVAKCRNGYVHDYDIVEGPMADDTVWNYVQDFLDGLITRKAFWELVRFKYPTHQISFHTLKALNCLKFERSESYNE